MIVEIQHFNLGIARACADDIGAVLGDISYLLLMAPIFDEAGATSGLTLKPAKRVLIIIGKPPTMDLTLRVREWLEVHLPQWAHFEVTDAAKYLGYWLGPRAASRCWTAPLRKWERRTLDVAASGAPAAPAARLYDTRAAAVLVYVAQLRPLPGDFRERERALLHRLLHLPMNTLSGDAFFELSEWGGPRLTSGVALAMAARFRAATVSLPTWSSSIALLENAADEHLPMILLVRGQVWHSWWDGPPVAFFLKAASEGFPALPRVRDALADLQVRRARLNRPQADAYTVIKRALHRPALAALVAKRLARLAPDALHAAPRPWALLRTALRKFSPHYAMSYLKTVTNAWANTSRYHEATRFECIFGCRQTDCLEHYLSCPRLWGAIGAVTGVRPIPEPAFRLGFFAAEAPARQVAAVMVAFGVYHALKIPGHASMAGNPLRPRPRPDIATSAGAVGNSARAVWNEISHIAG